MSAVSLAAFQDAFAEALLAADATAARGPAALLATQPAFAVYRNTVLKGLVDALHANYPAVARIVGDEWLRAAAAVYARAHPPRHVSLVDYGDGFAEFLAGFPPAQAIDYLAPVARVDRMWTEVHVAADAPALDPARVAASTPDDLEHIALQPHPAARWAWFDAQPIATLWRRNRLAPDTVGDPLDWRGEGVLLTRPGGAFGAVEATPLDRGACAFLDACRDGASVAAAAAAALETDPAIDLSRALGTLLSVAAFAATSDPTLMENR